MATLLKFNQKFDKLLLIESEEEYNKLINDPNKYLDECNFFEDIQEHGELDVSSYETLPYDGNKIYYVGYEMTTKAMPLDTISDSGPIGGYKIPGGS